MLTYVLRSVLSDWSKNFCPLIITLQSFISTFGTKYLWCDFLFLLLLNDITKGVFTPWNLGSIKKYKYGFRVCISIFYRYLFPLFVLLKSDFNCYIRFASSLVNKNTTRKLISQLTKGISRVFQNVLKYFNGTTISTFLYYHLQGILMLYLS